MTYNPHHTEEPATECIWCGGYIHAGSYPPICDNGNCNFEIDIAVAYQKMAEEYNGRSDKNESLENSS